MYTINFWPILVAAIVAFGIGALWYSPILFGKEWMSLSKITDADMKEARTKGMWISYLVQFVMALVTFCVLGFIISTSDSISASDGAFIGFLSWLGLVLPIGVSSLLWEKKPLKLVAINTISILLNLLIGGAIIGAWR